MKSMESVRLDFKEHIATLTKVSDEVSILDWQKPNDWCYTVRYVMDRNYLYISGDLGTAVFDLTWRANNLKAYSEITNLYYWHEKLSAYHQEEWDFNSEEAIKDIKEHFEERMDEDDEYENKELMDSLIESAELCSTHTEWVSVINNELNSEISEYDCDYWEWAYDIGRVIPTRIKMYLVGLKMAYEQLAIK